MPLLLALATIVSAAPVAPPPPPTTEWESAVAAALAARWHLPVTEVCVRWNAPTDVARHAGSRLASLAVDDAAGGVVAVAESDQGRTALRGRGGARDTVWVASRPLVSGDAVALGDAVAVATVAWGAPRPRIGPPAAGAVARRAVAAGEPLRWPAVAEAPCVAAGDVVRLQWSRGGVDVSLSGVAIAAARRGGRVVVRIAGRSGSASGIAIAPGIVALNEGDRP